LELADPTAHLAPASRMDRLVPVSRMVHLALAGWKARSVPGDRTAHLELADPTAHLAPASRMDRLVPVSRMVHLALAGWKARSVPVGKKAHWVPVNQTVHWGRGEASVVTTDRNSIPFCKALLPIRMLDWRRFDFQLPMGSSNLNLPSEELRLRARARSFPIR